jgi:hypothetical protein
MLLAAFRFRIRMVFGLLDQDPEFIWTDPAADPSINKKKKLEKSLISTLFCDFFMT